MNIHFAFKSGSPARITTGMAKAMGLPIGSKLGTQPPRTRVGLKGKNSVYPGGKALRRAHRALNARKTHAATLKQPGTIPGSMQAR